MKFNCFQCPHPAAVRQADRPLHGRDHRHVREGVHARAGLRRAALVPPEGRGGPPGNERSVLPGQASS